MRPLIADGTINNRSLTLTMYYIALKLYMIFSSCKIMYEQEHFCMIGLNVVAYTHSTSGKLVILSVATRLN